MKQTTKGFSLVEVMLAVAIIAVLSLGVLSMFQFALKVIAENKAREGAISIANEVVETIHNLPYDDVGTVGGLVSGVVPQSETVTLNNINYSVISSITYVDDPFDGTVSAGTDTLGNDYKKLRIAVSWIGHFGLKEIITVTTIAPRGIETNEGGGVLRITVVNANGEPVPQASIRVINSQTNPPIDDSSLVTDDNGEFLSAVPAANSSYQIVVTKNGYSSDYNCAIQADGTGCSVTMGNPDPVKPLLTVLEGQLTETTFIIDRVSTLDIRTVSQTNIPTEWIVNTDGGTTNQRRPAIAVSTNGDYYFAWQDFRNSAARIYGQHYNGQTAQWNPDLAITTSNNQNGPDIALTTSGNAYVTWFDDRNGNQDIYFNKYSSSGTELLGGSKKINTDAGSADQIYPKIIVAPTSTEIIFVGWKDNRAGGGDSDIYLQRFDSAGTEQWPSELKVNFNNSAYYQSNNAATWDFETPSNYICDGGNCDGDTDAQITAGKAQLVPIQSCQGTATACTTFVTQTSCTAQLGCGWDASGPCENGSCSCSSIDDQSSCGQTGSCTWQAGSSGCTGSCDCWAISNRGRCQAVTGCAWFVWFCYPTAAGCSCPSITNQTICTDADCGWAAGGGQCTGSCSCSAVSNQSVCTEASCTWDAAGPCSGTPSLCTTFTDQSSCGNQQGCSWGETGSGYPTTTPAVMPINSLTVDNLLRWDSFTETATKNGGEIYYQLSSDDGTTWQYWNGSAWATAGATNYNTAAAVNGAIAQFPTANEKILYKAFLSSPAGQQVSLDTVEIGYTYTTAGGNFSQSVDLAIDDASTLYVAWETYTTDNYNIFLQKVSQNGSVVWPNDIQGNAHTAGDQTNPAVITDSDNNLYVVWQDNRDGTNRIYGQKYDADGTALWAADDVAISFDDSAEQQNPRLAIDSDNNLYVVWQDTRNGTNDIYSQKLDANGNRLWTKDIRINLTTSGDQSLPDVLINPSGNLVVTWQDNRNAHYDIVAVEYSGDPSSTAVVPNVPLTIVGSKQVGKTPVIYKYQQNLSTNSSGQLLLNNLEWDEYTITLQGGSGYTIVGAEPPIPIALDPNTTLTVTITLE